MISISKIRLYMLIGTMCITIMFIHPTLVIAQEVSPNKSSSFIPSETCISCNNIEIKCPACPEDSKCIMTIRTCSECQKAKCVKLPPNESSDNKNNNAVQNSNKVLLPAVIGGILGIGFLTAIGYGYFVWRRRTRYKRGVKLNNSEEMTSTDGENVIPIAYIPSSPSSPTTSKPEPTYPRLRISHVSGGTSPLASPLPYNLNDEKLVDITGDDDDDDDCTILKAKKTAPKATLMTATRVKPALFKLNTVKAPKEMSPEKSTRSRNSIPNPPKSSMTDNTFLSAPSISSVPNSPTFKVSEAEQITPHIDIERASAESTRVTSQDPASQHLTSPFLDPIEGRQSFGLFGSDEVYSDDPSSPQLQRESMLSSTSSNGRSTISSVDGDGEIMIFWGGNTPPLTATGEGNQIQVKEPENYTDKDPNEETKTKESI